MIFKLCDDANDDNLLECQILDSLWSWNYKVLLEFHGGPESAWKQKGWSIPRFWSGMSTIH